MFTKSKVSQSMLDAVNSVLKNQPVVEEKKITQVISEQQVAEVAPPGFEGTVKAMKKHKDIDNPFALAWSMKNKGYKSHKKADGTQKEEVESVEEALKGDQHKIDKNKNNKIDAQDFKILRKEETVEEGVGEKVKTGFKKFLAKVGGGSDEDQRKRLQKNMGIPQTGKPSMAKQNEEVESVEEGWDDMVKAAKDSVKSGPKPSGGSGVKQGTRYGGSKQKDEKETQKEAVDPTKKTTDTLAGPVKGGKENEHVGYKVKLKTEAKTLSPGQDDAPFDPPYSPAPRDIKDKSGATHTPMSRAKDLARTAMKRVKMNLKDKK